MYDVSDYQAMLHKALSIQGDPHLIPLADHRLCGRLMKSMSPAHARGFVAAEAIAQARQDLRAQVGKIPADAIALREVELNRLAARLS
ncbi:MAG: hypothetical protein IT487_06410 [Chromatiaceae bacterium]|nr:hypothetical protein [Chromatiaceae bacterium]